MGHGAAMSAKHGWPDPSKGVGRVRSAAWPSGKKQRTVLELELFLEKLLGALIMLAGDPDMNRHTKFDPPTAPPVNGLRATVERARLAMLLSAFGTLSPQHTEAWTTSDGQ